MLLMNEIIERIEGLRRNIDKCGDPDLLNMAKRALNQGKWLLPYLKNQDCQRFFISSEAVEKMWAVSAKDMEKVIEIAKIPYEVMWIECTLTLEGVSGYRTGVLLLTNPDGAIRICFVSLNRSNGAEGINVFDMESDFFTKIGKGARCHEIRLEKVTTGMLDEPMSERQVCSLANIVARLLILINTPRLTEVTESEDFIALNKKRERQGKPPLVNYRTVDLSKDMKRRIRESEEHEKLHGKAFHYVRGHFKYLKHANVPGLYWWSPHIAGSKEFGTVHKAYVHGKTPNGGESIH